MEAMNSPAAPATSTAATMACGDDGERGGGHPRRGLHKAEQTQVLGLGQQA